MENENSQNRLESSKIVVRQHYLDNFRTFLTVCVIFMHTSIAYGGSGRWMYSSRAHRFSLPLLAFNAILSTFALPGFFFLSGHFSAQAVSRKSRYDFLISKLVRLGIPTLFYTLFLAPIPHITVRLCLPQPVDHTAAADSIPDNYLTAVAQMLLVHLRSVRGVQGPPWYCATLLLFDLALLPFTPSQPRPKPKPNNQLPHPHAPRPATILTTLLATALASFLLRLYIPTTYRFPPLNLPPASLPQFIAAYALGRATAAPEALLRSYAALCAPLLSLGVATSAVMAALLARGYEVRLYAGGGNAMAAAYVVWDGCVGLLVGGWLMGGLKRLEESGNGNGKGAFWEGVARAAYGAFLVHPVVCVAVMVGLDGWELGGVAKTGVVGLLGVLGSWGVARLALGVPGVGMVI